jgi:cell wall-associated NlpC family hydrolase
MAASQDQANQDWVKYEKAVLQEPKTLGVSASSECDPYRMILETSFSWTEAQKMICRNDFNKEKLNKDLSVLAKIAAITPEVIQSIPGSYKYYRSEVLAMAQNLKACAKQKYDGGRIQNVLIRKSTGSNYVVSASGASFDRETYNLARRFYLVKLLMDLSSEKVDFCSVNFQNASNVRFRTLAPGKVKKFSEGQRVHPAVASGITLIAALHQSCDAANLSVSGPEFEGEVNWYNDGRKSYNFSQNYSAFAKRLRTDSCSQDFELPYYSWVDRNPKISFPEKLDGVPQLKFVKKGTDCSSFITTAYAASGLRFFKNTDDIYQFFPKDKNGTPNAYNTTMLKGLPDKPESCFHNVDFSRESYLKPGDVLVGGGHTWLVATASDDPFGFRTMNKKDCSDFSKYKLNFTVLESDESDRGMGPRHHHGSAAWAQINQLASLACKAHFGGRKNSVFAKTKSDVLIRHSGKPECKMSQTPHLVGTKCVSSCPIVRQLNKALTD